MTTILDLEAERQRRNDRVIDHEFSTCEDGHTEHFWELLADGRIRLTGWDNRTETFEDRTGRIVGTRAEHGR